jgi:CBS domain-containing protein
MLDSTGNHKRTSSQSKFAAACVATAFRAAMQAPGARSDATMHCGSSTRGEHQMNVRDGMSKVVLSVGPAHTLREAARLMSAQRVGAAVVVDPAHPGIGILTERDILDSVGAGQDPDAEMVADHRTSDVVFASPDWTLEQAASAMSAGNFRHLIVVDNQDVAGLLSMRDIVRCWTGAGVSATASV